MSSSGRGRSAKTKGVAESTLHGNARKRHGIASQQERLSYPSAEVARRYVEAQLCPICEKGPFKLLPMHTNQAHGIDKYELREMAGLSTLDPITSPEFREAQAQRMRERNLSPETFKAMAAARRGKGTRRVTTAGREKMSANISSIMGAMTPEERTAQWQKALDASTLAGRERQAEGLARWHERRPRKGHGTAAAYKRGCRCDACREAKRATRPKTAGVRSGEAHPNARLNWDLVSRIRAARESGARLAEIAAWSGVSEATVSLVARNKIWNQDPKKETS